jgi:hypothetical protein
MAPPDPRSWARVPPHLAWRRPGLPTVWVPVIDRNDEAMYPDAKPGYVWLQVGDRRLHVWVEHLEFRNTPPKDRRDGPRAP